MKLAWLVPLVAFEWAFEWLAYLLSRWSFLEVLEYLGSFSILVAVIFYFSESGDRLKQKHYQAWQVINTANGTGGSGGRIEALQELNVDGVPLVGVSVSGAFLQAINLSKARLHRSDFSSADARNSRFEAADLSDANLRSANFRDANLSDADLQNAELNDGDFCRANLTGVDLSGANLEGAELGSADVRNVKWQQVKSVKGTNIRGLRNPPDGFVAWATQHGAITSESQSDCH
jgi:hypothetical protein